MAITFACCHESLFGVPRPVRTAAVSTHAASPPFKLESGGSATCRRHTERADMAVLYGASSRVSSEAWLNEQAPTGRTGYAGLGRDQQRLVPLLAEAQIVVGHIGCLRRAI
jgi:hypothetical protein